MNKKTAAFDWKAAVLGIDESLYNLLSSAGMTRSGTKGFILSLTAPLAVYLFN